MESPTWFYVIRENELPNVGDFKLLRVAQRSLIVVRDEDGRIQVLFNVCRHRRVPVCRQARGNTRIFTCMFHGWVYNTKGLLVGVQGPGRSVREFPEREGLPSMPRVAASDGCVYASLASEGESLHEYLGRSNEK